MKRHGLPNFAPEIAPYDLESSGKKSTDKYHGKGGKKVDMDGMKQIGSIVGAIWLGGVFLLGYDWLWPLYLLLNILDLFSHIPILGSIVSWVLTPLSWLGGFANRGAPYVEQLGPLQEPRLPSNQVSTYANSYVQQYGDAALILAAHDGYAQIVTALLTSRDLGYRDLIEAADEHGNTALIYAAAKGFPQCTAALLKSGADPDIANQAGGGRTPLMEASGAGHVQIATALLATKANVEMVDDYGNTALHYAAYNGHLSVVRELLKANPRRDVKNSNGETAASYATKNRHKGVADLLLRPPTHREKAALASEGANDDLADLVAGRSGRKDAQGRSKGAEAGAAGKKKDEDDHMSKLMKLLGKGKDEEAEEKPEDQLTKMMKELSGGKEKEKAEEDHVSKLMSLFGGKEDKAKKEKEKAEDDTLSKLTKLFAGKEKESEDSRVEELRKQHEQAELKSQKRIVELMEQNSEHQKAVDEARREARLHKLNVTEMSYQLQSLQSKVQAAELKAFDEKTRADQLFEEKQKISFEVDQHKTRADSAERERDMHMDASRRHQERLSQTHAELTDHLSRLEKQSKETSALREEMRKREERIAELERELQKRRLEAASSPPSPSLPEEQPLGETGAEAAGGGAPAKSLPDTGSAAMEPLAAAAAASEAAAGGES